MLSIKTLSSLQSYKVLKIRYLYFDIGFMFESLHLCRPVFCDFCKKKRIFQGCKKQYF